MRSRVKPGTVAGLILDYQQSDEWKELDRESKNQFNSYLNRARDALGDRPAATISRKEIKAFLDTIKPPSPDPFKNASAFNQMLKRLSVLFKFAIATDVREDNPTFGIKKAKTRPGGWPKWSMAHVEQFRAYWAEGTRARLCFEELFYTEQRISDVVRMGWWCVIDGKLDMTQWKGRNRNGGSRVISPLDPYLLGQLERHCPKNAPTFLVGEQGRPYSAKTGSQWFAKCVREAGLPKGLAAHGLRKTSLTRIVDAGGTPYQIMARGGFKSLQHVMTYTKDYDTEKRAKEALDLVRTPTAQERAADEAQKWELSLWAPIEMVGGTGIEPVTPRV